MSLVPLFAPRGIALLGASADPAKISGKPLHYLRRHGYGGRLVAVNPKYRDLAGVPCVASLAEAAAGGPLDLALVVLGQEGVLAALDQCREAGVKAAVVFGSGYAEVGPEGALQQQVLIERARAAGVRLLGPNCQGFINVADRVAASFTSALDAPALVPGGIALVTQSGALGGVLLNRAQERALGLGLWVSTGNEADVSWLDCAEYALEHPATRVVAVYAESIADGRRLLDLGETAARRGVPIVLLEGGRSDAGRAAAESHTGALVASGAAGSLLETAAGIVPVTSLEALLDVGAALAVTGAPAGPRVAVATSSGGAGVLFADATQGRTVTMATLGARTSAALREALPGFASVANPVDVTAQIVYDPDLLRRALAAILADPEVDMAAVLLTMVTGPLAPPVARGIAEAARAGGKPVAVAWMAGALAQAGYDLLREEGVPCYPSIEGCLAALEGLARWGAARRRPARARPSSRAVSLPRGVLTERAARAFLGPYGLDGPSERFCETARETRAAADALGYPVVLKVEADGLAHKSEAGGVRTGLADGAAVVAAYDAMLGDVRRLAPHARVRGVLVQAMVRGVAELLVGATRDPRFGPVVSCGLGGIFVEVLGDVVARPAPVDDGEAREMLASLKAFPLLAGARGRAKADLGAAARAVAAVSRAAVDLGDALDSVEVNPLIVLPEGQGAVAVDALVIVR